MPRKVFVNGNVLTDTDLNTYLMNQAVMTFASSAARSSAIGTATEGMVTYLEDSNSIQVYDGATWGTVYPISAGDITDVVAGTALSGGGTSGSVTLNVNYTTLSSAIAGTGLTATSGTLIVNPVAINSPVATVTAAYTAVTGDNNELLVANGTAAYTITVPDVLSLGGRLDIVRNSSGTVTIAAGTGVTDWAGAGTAGTAVTFKIDQQYNAATVFKTGSGQYRVVGKITA